MDTDKTVIPFPGLIRTSPAPLPVAGPTEPPTDAETARPGPVRPRLSDDARLEWSNACFEAGIS